MAFLKKLRFPKFSRNKKETAETKVTDEKFPSDVVDAEKKAVDAQLSPVAEDRDGADAESANMDASSNAEKTKGSVNGSEVSVGDASESREVPESSQTTKSDWDCCGVSLTMP
ncbi:hypothetical protein FisN_21Lh210 [Fistulifera solaris]|uniref:Uncharacterized protein n=1 Tax=Fistulifera solaris TaxID=1519565 RepID=A0A1Z5J944_FISSO|nr:hypothetical protein FisN_21Lh210 [Fistulifera solaris]|eukprot:GAX10505.1 hypothetical protein FisN_21Lh210 [Fistulifera solaris]